MIIDLNEEEWEFLQRMCTRIVAIEDMKDFDMIPIKGKDYRNAKRLLERFIKEKK